MHGRALLPCARCQDIPAMVVADGRRGNKLAGHKSGVVEILSRRRIEHAHHSRGAIEPRSSRGPGAGAQSPSRGRNRVSGLLAERKRLGLLYAGADQPERISHFPAPDPTGGNVYQAGFDAAWELDVFGGTRRAVEAAKSDIAGAEYGRRAVLVSLLGEVARYYVEARGFQQRLVIARQNIQAQQAILSLTRSRYKGGLTSELDVQQASALLSTTKAQVPAFESSFAEAAHRLAVLLGQPPGALLAELSREAPIPKAPPPVPVGLPSELLRRRPDIQQAERQLAGANARIGMAVADLYPKFSLTGDVGLQSVSASDWFSPGSRFCSVGPTVQWRIFDAGRIRANIRVQNAREEQALAHYEQTVLASFEDVENALTAYAKEQIRRQSLAEAVQANQQGLQLAGELYRSGVEDFLHVLDSQRSLYESQDALVESERTVALDLIKLYKALGGGWESVEREPANHS